MSMHPYFTEQVAADHRRELMRQAADHRLARQAKTASQKQPITTKRTAHLRRLRVLLTLRRPGIVEAS